MTILAMIIGFILDIILGDPYSMPHPVRVMGNAISKLEVWLRDRFPATPRGEKQAGLCIAFILPVSSFVIYFMILWLCELIHPIVRLIIESFMCYQLLAARCLYDESMKVYKALKKEDIEGARYAVSMIVGRDTKSLDASGIAKAAVETVAENLSDGEIAPLCYMALGGAPLMALYKSVNTLDSMIGYRNERYKNFGFASAKLDDILNFIPSRISGLLIVLSAFVLKLNGKGAWRIFKRDRGNHKSPNSAQTEAPCAGALDIQLAGDALYGGKLVVKPTIGDNIKAIQPKDIRLANKLMLCSAAMGLILCALLRLLIAGWR